MALRSTLIFSRHGQTGLITSNELVGKNVFNENPHDTAGLPDSRYEFTRSRATFSWARMEFHLVFFLLVNHFMVRSSAFSLHKVSRLPIELKSERVSLGGGIFYDGPRHEYTGQRPHPTNGQTFDFSKETKSTQHRDIVVIGGGLAGLATALYLSQVDPTRHVTILERESQQKTTVASFAAAGMLAPQSERLPSGPLLDLCVSSRQCYRDFVDLVEKMAQASGDEGQQYLKYGDGKVGYMASGGFLAPAFAGDSVATWSPPDCTAKWLDSTQVRELEPSLNPEVIGGWWFPEDASVDARRLTCALRAACISAGVEIKIGPQFEVSSLDLLDGECRGLYLMNGKYVKTKAVLVANGSWMRQLLPIPVEPHKGQSLSLRMPADKPALLKRVLFAQDSYIVPKSDGRIIVGATVEAGSFDANVTPAGIMHILHHALLLVPGLADLPIEESWVGLRPTTPDKGPILGKTSWSNLFVAGGYWRNGVLLAPKTGQIMAQLIAGQELSASDQALLDAFSWDRFTTAEGSKRMEIDARFAASLYPVHRRAEGAGVSAAVGTELGSYSTARSSRNERARDRASLFGDSEDSLEIAAKMGTEDASVFSGYEEKAASDSLPGLRQSPAEPFVGNETSASMRSPALMTYEGSSDAYTVIAEDDEEDLGLVYNAIKNNMATRDIEMVASEEEVKPDPGFRIYYVNPDTGHRHEIPPYTSFGDIKALVAEDTAISSTLDNGGGIAQEFGVVEGFGRKKDAAIHHDKGEIKDGTLLKSRRNHYVDGRVPADDDASSLTDSVLKSPVRDNSESNGHDTRGGQDPDFESVDMDSSSLDGYSSIQTANSRDSRDAELEVMRAARKLNRVLSDVDTSKIGVLRPEDLVT